MGEAVSWVGSTSESVLAQLSIADATNCRAPTEPFNVPFCSSYSCVWIQLHWDMTSKNYCPNSIVSFYSILGMRGLGRDIQTSYLQRTGRPWKIPRADEAPTPQPVDRPHRLLCQRQDRRVLLHPLLWTQIQLGPGQSTQDRPDRPPFFTIWNRKRKYVWLITNII